MRTPQRQTNFTLAAFAEKVERLALAAWFPIVTIGLAIVVRLLWIALVNTRPVSDFGWYYEQGLRIAEGRGYSVDHDGFPLWTAGRPLPAPRPTAFWPVGYAGFLGALFFATKALIPPLLSAKLANVALQVATAWISARVAGKLYRSLLVERLTLLLVAFAPNAIAYSGLTATESWFTFLVCAGIALLLRAAEDEPALKTESTPGVSARARVASLLAAGVVFGVATLTKPQIGLLPVLVLLLLRRDWKRGLREALLVHAIAIAVVLPWTLRNYQAFGTPVAISTNGWVNLLIGNLPGSWGKAGVMWNQELQQIIDQHRDELDWNAAAREVVVQYIIAHPWQVLASVPGKVFALLAVDVDGFGWSLAGAPEHQHARFWLPLRALAQGYYLAGLALFASLLVHLVRVKPIRSQWLAPLVVGYFTAIYAVFFGGPRFHYPFLPWLYACAALELGRRLGLAAAATSRPSA